MWSLPPTPEPLCQDHDHSVDDTDPRHSERYRRRRRRIGSKWFCISIYLSAFLLIRWDQESLGVKQVTLSWNTTRIDLHQPVASSGSRAKSSRVTSLHGLDDAVPVGLQQDEAGGTSLSSWERNRCGWHRTGTVWRTLGDGFDIMNRLPESWGLPLNNNVGT